MAPKRPQISYVIDPRFPGGTSSAVADELAVAVQHGAVTVHAVSSAMLKGRAVAPVLERALADMGLRLVWDAPAIGGDLVVLHNPSFLKFQARLAPRIVAHRLVVVTHENFSLPSGRPGFDVAGCLRQIDAASYTAEKLLAPVSPYNRQTVLAWAAAHTAAARPWAVAPEDWFNICATGAATATPRPRDRRGRHSRAGLEKFPPLADLDLTFPASAEMNVILGADTLMSAGPQRPHWALFPFHGIEIEQYFEMIDFMVYHTAPTLRESFGRVLAEGIAAGKVVVADPDTAQVFGDGVIPARPAEVADVIARHIEAPTRYAEQVARGRTMLARFSADRFAQMFARHLAPAEAAA